MHQAVRPHALLGGLLDVEVDQATRVADADRHSQPVARRARSPRAGRVEGVDVAEPEQLHVVGVGGGDVDGGAGGGVRTDGLQRRDPPGEGFGRREVALIDEGLDRLLADAHSEHGQLVELGPTLSELEPEPGRVLELVPAGRHVQQRDAVQPVGRHDMVAGRQVATVDHQQDVRRRRALVGAEAGPVAQVGRQQDAEVVERGGDQPTRADRIDLAPALRVGEPLDPVPVREVVLGAEDRDHELVRVVEGGGGADHGAGRRAGVLLGAAELDPVEGPQVDRCRQVGLETVYDEEPVQRGRGRGVDLVDRGALRGISSSDSGWAAQAVADVQEVVVARTVLPQAGAVLGQRRERGRLGVVPDQRPALLVGGVARDLADVGEVAEVLGAGAGDLLRALLTLPVDLHDDEAERGEEEHAGREEAAGAVAASAHRRDQHDRAEAAEHRDRVHQDAAGALVLLQLRRRLQHDLTARHLRLVEPLSASQCSAHDCPAVRL